MLQNYQLLFKSCKNIFLSFKFFKHVFYTKSKYNISLSSCTEKIKEKKLQKTRKVFGLHFSIKITKKKKIFIKILCKNLFVGELLTKAF